MAKTIKGFIAGILLYGVFDVLVTLKTRNKKTSLKPSVGAMGAFVHPKESTPTYGFVKDKADI